MEIKVASEYVTLGQLLKMTDFIQSGGEAKYAVKSLVIKVNNELENRRGRKLYAGDIVNIEGRTFHLL